MDNDEFGEASEHYALLNPSIAVHVRREERSIYGLSKQDLADMNVEQMLHENLAKLKEVLRMYPLKN